ncbi:post-transcriptional regulator [Bacillus solitudinis]|uniref:post-transcriptional regulator n=1 Tax=Bacillus solitudinis TaxID=2014074 RepID=UPI000C2398DE|nr:post-transcriptional regulator [Bacillus solitudinis]
MEEKQQFDSWREDVSPCLQSKLDEFHFLGYGRATSEDIWKCVIHRLRKRKDFMHLHEFVNVLLTLKPQDYMTWLTVNSYKEPEDWFFELKNKS